MLRALALALVAATTACAARQPLHATSPTDAATSASPAPPGSSLIRVVTAPRIREISAALPAPHRTTTPAPIPHTPLDLRSLVGIRDKRTSLLLAIEWAQGLGLSPEGFAGTTGDDLVAWATESHRIADAHDEPHPGDLLIFDTAVSDAPSDLVAVVIARDDRGVTEMAYLGGGVIRRGFVDPSRPTKRRDKEQRVVNTYLRHGSKWPTKGTHYLAGELLAHVIHLR
jgi:hypothetical protein